MMKKIGIVGGLSPESTALYYKTIINEYRRLFNSDNYPEIIIYSVSFGEFVNYMRRKEYSNAFNMLLKAIKSLNRAGADFALIAANTPHIFFDELERQSPIPLINIVDALAGELIKDKVSTVGLLGTETTLLAGFYSKRLMKYGIRTLIPSPKDIREVNRIIFNELVWGVIRDESRSRILSIIERLRSKGAEAVALACTELPLLIKDERIGSVRVYDTARIHAKKALEYALSS